MIDYNELGPDATHVAASRLLNIFDLPVPKPTHETNSEYVSIPAILELTDTSIHRAPSAVSSSIQ